MRSRVRCASGPEVLACNCCLGRPGDGPVARRHIRRCVGRAASQWQWALLARVRQGVSAVAYRVAAALRPTRSTGNCRLRSSTNCRSRSCPRRGGRIGRAQPGRAGREAAGWSGDAQSQAGTISSLELRGQGKSGIDPPCICSVAAVLFLIGQDASSPRYCTCRALLNQLSMLM